MISEGIIRLCVTGGLIAFFVLLEALRPARTSHMTAQRLGRHGGLAITGAVVSRLALTGGLAGIATFAQGQSIGILNWLDWHPWINFGVALFVLDFSIWAQHLALHRIGFLWRLHRMHHSDLVMDVSTALRFHPLEIVGSLAFKSAVIMALGAPPAAVVVFEIVLGAGALFTHANIAVSPQWEKRLRLVLITPALHLIHHSPNPIETNSNFGTSTNLWDRLFGTYRPAQLAETPEIGLDAWREKADQRFTALLANPFR
jgi:sterol desaturase/sphingolipid hydroxylase (fatty acid hydroxylase superfamily)